MRAPARLPPALYTVQCAAGVGVGSGHALDTAFLAVALIMLVCRRRRGAACFSARFAWFDFLSICRMQFVLQHYGRSTTNRKVEFEPLSTRYRVFSLHS